jgi:hypothetical protein
MSIIQKPVIKSYLCTAFDDTQFITNSIEYETIWLEKDGVRFPIRGPILAKKVICVPEYSIAYGVSWKPLERWIAIKEFIELDESN